MWATSTLPHLPCFDLQEVLLLPVLNQRNNRWDKDESNAANIECKIINHFYENLCFYSSNIQQQNTPQQKFELDGITFTNCMANYNEHVKTDLLHTENTRTVVDDDNVNTIVNYKDLVNFISENFVHCGCKHKVSKKNYCHNCFGIATLLQCT